ncbi:MAG: DUF559 domain-containing protein [Myxococcales bacterium]|nr:DUF559 domain-containing protein [Myxococcales bacterium]
MARLRRPETHRARTLRRASTHAERALWQLLRGRQLEHAKFRRQQPLGRFIVDFFCEAARLVVEVDGGHHDDPSVAARDAARDALLRAAGLTVLRLPNEQILHDPEGALERIRPLLRAPGRRGDTR